MWWIAMMVLANSQGSSPLPTLLFSFETPAEVTRIELHQTDATITQSWATEGRYSLEAHFSQASWPNLYFRVERAFSQGNWSIFAGLALDVKNPSSEPLHFCLRVDDDFSADGYHHCRTGRAILQPYQSATVVMPLSFNPPPGMRGAPPLLPNALTMNTTGSELNWSHIVAFQIFLPQPQKPRSLLIDNIRLLPRKDWKGIVDPYGQYTQADWPGKVYRLRDLLHQKEQENLWLESHPPLKDRDEYGGWREGPTLRATGWFRTAFVYQGKEVPFREDLLQKGGRWWLVTPTGKLFFSLGVDCVRYNEATPTKGREKLFTYLPSSKGPLEEFAPQGPEGWVSFYAINLKRKYGRGWKEDWRQITLKRLLSWGFNTIGNWSTPEVFRLRRIPYVVPIHYDHSRLIRFSTAWQPMVDVFDERFPKVIEEAITRATQEWKEDPWCIGYFVDNELSWGGWGASPSSRYDLPRRVLSVKENLPAKREFIRWLRAKYGDVESFSRAWGISITSWKDLENQPLIFPDPMTPSCIADLSDLLRLFARRYFEVVSSLLKKYAPHQLYLGCRFAPRPLEVVQESAKYCDVITFNIYTFTIDSEEWAFTNSLGKPCLIGEFHFGALDRGMFHQGLVPVANQKERGEAYQAYVRSVWALPAFVGCHWFQYVDQPLTGRFDGENYNIGFLSVTDYPHWDLVESARQIHQQVYEKRGMRL